MLSLSGDYDGELVGRHQWMGIFTAILSLVLYLLYQFSISETIARWISLGIIILVTITGHLGGSLTHGSDYLTEGLHSDDDKGPCAKSDSQYPGSNFVCGCGATIVAGKML